MQGYFQEPERTADVMRDGWYVTGDMACANGRYTRYATARVRKDRRLNINLPIPFDG